MAVRTSSSISPQFGFHRTFTTSIIPGDSNWASLVDESQCSVHLHYKFPVLVFVDPYELANYQQSYSFEHYGNANLELPVAAMDPNGTSLLLTLTKSTKSTEFEVKVPFHVRYGQISLSDETHRTAEIAWPLLLLSCPSSVSPQEFSKLVTYSSPPPTEFASLFQGSSLYVPQGFDPDAARKFEVVAAPVGQYADVAQVRLGTAATILAMFFYVAYVLYQAARRLGNQGSATKED
ncbi:hypothetical protein GYMLUDRAFT_99295 [Collybiopsis luxurians FD-317 M1]|uniref:Protein PBN1 n=1 Tax=Collybiopsis luxurians FD-317 M1 TaxID=944289 RepID=A0A0D0BMG9_9AGAR|nr:hypothetical protein GYMLUDRAFT_99295 [Collybiopsis luxurians FD-317 M1]